MWSVALFTDRADLSYPVANVSQRIQGLHASCMLDGGAADFNVVHKAWARNSTTCSTDGAVTVATAKGS